MEELQITLEELSKMQQLGRGACSIVYKYTNDLVIKILNETGIQMHNEDDFSNIIGIENSTCVFPKNRITIDGIFKGYSMEYVNGIPLHEVIKDLDLRSLISAIQVVENDLMQLSSKKILFDDLNQGGIMWDTAQYRIKIIDTDFFQKDENLKDEQCYNANIASFNSMIEMELGILNGQGTKLSEYLQNNPEFSKLYSKYVLSSLTGKSSSITVLITKAIEIMEKDFGTEVKTIHDMQHLIDEPTHSLESDFEDNIPTFAPPEEHTINKNIGLKQKFINFLADKHILWKIPFINKLVLQGTKLLPEATNESMPTPPRPTKHDEFVNKISNNGEYRRLFRTYIKDLPGINEPKSMADPDKIRQIKEKMNSKIQDNDPIK